LSIQSAGVSLAWAALSSMWAMGGTKEGELSVAWKLGQDDESCVQLSVSAKADKVGMVVRDEDELPADGDSQ
jgi:hypothetical protein